MINAKRIFILLLIFLQTSSLIAKEIKVGTTFSKKQCEYLGINWKETYLSILKEGFDLIRLGAYWNEIEKEEGIYDYKNLDWQVNEAKKKKIKIVLTVGMKAPRWPEYFIPKWVLSKSNIPFGRGVSKNTFLKERTLRFIQKTIERYRKEKAIIVWQVENEAFNRIGEKSWFVDREFLQKEITLVKDLDGERPILLTAATYPNSFLRMIADLTKPYKSIKEYIKMADIIGLNIYPQVGHKAWGMNFYFGSNPSKRYTYFKGIIEEIKEAKKDVWVLELQAEPWEPGHLVYKRKEDPVTSLPKETEEVFQDFLSLGVDTIFLWGAEYWNYRKIQYGDLSWEKAVNNILKQRNKT